MWPHENNDLLPKRKHGIFHIRIGESDPLRAAKIREVARLVPVWAGVVLHTVSRGIAEQKTSAVVNSREAAVLSDKFSFNTIVRSLGYGAPEQTLVRPGCSSEELEQIGNGFQNKFEKVICKPVGCSGGKGIVVCRPQDVQFVLADNKRAYLVQEFVKPYAEFRYVLFEDVNGNKWRICYKKQRPTLKGDGNHNVCQLMKGKELPWTTQLATAIRHRKYAFTSVPEGTELQINQILNPKGHNYEGLANDREVAGLDKIMPVLVRDIEKTIGKLKVVCFDVGIRDESFFNPGTSPEVQKKLLALYECQMPFSTFKYYSDHSEGWRDKIRMVVRTHRLMAQAVLGIR